jgi:hypothetical protein
VSVFLTSFRLKHHNVVIPAKSGIQVNFYLFPIDYYLPRILFRDRFKHAHKNTPRLSMSGCFPKWLQGTRSAKALLSQKRNSKAFAEYNPGP